MLHLCLQLTLAYGCSYQGVKTVNGLNTDCYSIYQLELQGMARVHT